MTQTDRGVTSPWQASRASSPMRSWTWVAWLALAIAPTAASDETETDDAAPLSVVARNDSDAAVHPGVPGRDWPQFRGRGAAGIADPHPLPIDWDVDTSENVAWSRPIPGLSHASPIVWDDRVYVVTAVAEGIDPELKVGLYGAGDSADDLVEHSFRLLAIDREDGSIVWDRVAYTGTPRFARHTKATHANSTPATDGEHVVVLFATGGLYCYNRDGDLQWHVDLGPLDVGPHDSIDLEWGFASSPIITRGEVIVQADVKESPFLASYDLVTGDLVWRVARDDLTGWSSPTACAVTADDVQIVVNGCRHMGAYQLTDGDEVWRMAGGGGIPIPTPIVADGRIYLTSNHRPIATDHPIKPIFAVPTTSRGDLGVPHENDPAEPLAWMVARYGCYLQTPLVYRDVAYFGKANGVVNAFDAATGELKNTVRLGSGRDGFSASPVAGDGKLYFSSEEGIIYVLSVDDELNTLATPSLGEICMATPAIASGMLIFRTRGHVIAIKSER